MKSISKKLIVLSIVFSMLMVTFMPLIAMAYDPATSSASEVATSTSTGETVIENVEPTKVASVDEVVDSDTNMVEYINAKKAEFANLISNLGVDESLYSDLFVTVEGNYKYIKVTSEDALELDGTTLKFDYTEVAVSKSKTTLTGADITLKAPKVGDKVEKIMKDDGYGEYPTQSSEPTVSTTTEGLFVNAFWVSGLEDLSEEPFYGTFEENTYYYAMIDFEAEEGYELATTFPDGLKINGSAPEEVFPVVMGTYNHCIAKIKATTTAEEEATAEDENTYEFIEGANQTYIVGNGESARFRIDANFALFEVGGAVYVDDELVGEDNYKAYSGSTVIELNEDYVSTLDEGEHTLRVAFNNGEESTTKFIVEGKETKKSGTPKTGDTIIIWAALIVVSILGIALTVKLSKKNK